MLTALRIVPSSNAARIDCAISIPTLSCASAVEAPRCGVRTRFEIFRSGESAGNGSVSKTSSAAPATWPLRNGIGQCLFIDQSAARAIDDAHAAFCFRETFRVQNMTRLRGKRRMQRNKISERRAIHRDLPPARLGDCARARRRGTDRKQQHAFQRQWRAGLVRCRSGPCR